MHDPLSSMKNWNRIVVLSRFSYKQSHTIDEVQLQNFAKLMSRLQKSLRFFVFQVTIFLSLCFVDVFYRGDGGDEFSADPGNLGTPEKYLNFR